MKSFLRNLFSLLVFFVLVTIGYELVIANVKHCQQTQYSTINDALIGHLWQTKKTINFIIGSIVQCSWNDFTLIRKALFLFHYRFYILAASLFLFVCYYEVRSRLSRPKEIKGVTYISTEAHEQMKKEQTEKEKEKLINSQAFQNWERTKNNQDEPIDVEKEEQINKDCRQFEQQLEEAEEKIFSQ